ncbi:DUF2510 domain-containing protein [Thermomonospora umbrina]|uniref:Uncharacterized protein DUF2510 n=1 Tax=Thermomonospora umbrina TaxID=111806 RepID=A0A3D9SNV0_9ACTN|nr:DUF2510 domain-containing protein [Thermomonospora umbrina]REE96120.1 uncharacterized protein DUF2510 [Thermomonospora umbrina]
MAQPGWYTDPHGTGRLRWWDGQRWTEHLHDQVAPPPQPQPRPSQQQPHMSYGQAYGPEAYSARTQPQPPPTPIAVDVRGFWLHADVQGVGYGNGSMPWAHVEWVAYWPAQPGQWVFQVGRHPFHGGPRVEVLLDQEDLWSRLADMSRRMLEPRLVGELAARVRTGEQIDVGQGLAVHRGGVSGGQISLNWRALAGGTIRDGRVWLHQAGAATPALYIPQQNPNAVLIPALLAELKR